MSLYDHLYAAQITCPVSETKFLPRSTLERTITEGAVRTVISARPWIHTIFWSDDVPNQILLNAIRIFAVLVLVGGEPEMIRKLISVDQVTDDHLPFELGSDGLVFSVATKQKFVTFNKWPKPRIQSFLDTQWVVLAPVFSTIGENILLHSRCPLSFLPDRQNKAQRGIAYIKVDDGGYHRVVVYRVTLEPSHRTKEFADYNEIAVKEVADKTCFEKEKENLERIQDFNHDHLIKFLASCEKRSVARCENDPVFYFMFPWADGGDLRQFWTDADGMPRTKDLFLWALGQILGIVDAVKLLHVENIRHGDIKPQNVLHFRSTSGGSRKPLGTLVLADLGISSHHDKATISRAGGTNTTEVTVLYEAPEAESDRRQRKPRSRRYDMWSLGCMFLEFTVWLIYGFEAVETFRDKRRTSWHKNPTTAPGNFFTERSKGAIEIHSKVLKAIRHIRTDPRCAGSTALADLIRLIEECLLRTNPSERAEAQEVHSRLEAIFMTAQDDPFYLFRHVEPVPETPKFFKPKGTPTSGPTSPKSSMSTLETTFSDEDPRDSVGSMSSTS